MTWALLVWTALFKNGALADHMAAVSMSTMTSSPSGIVVK